MSESFRFAAGAARTTLAVVAAIVAVVVITQQSRIRNFLSEGLGVGPYESTSLEPVTFTVITRDGVQYDFSTPRIYLLQHIGGGHTFETSIGETAFVVSLDISGGRPCRGVDDCIAEIAVRAAFPYPYEIGDGEPPATATAHEARESDVAGFALTVTSGAGSSDPTASIRTETRRYRAEADALAPRMDCDMAIAGNVEGGLCHVAVRWGGEDAYIDVAMAARYRTRVHEISAEVAALFDSFAIETAS